MTSPNGGRPSPIDIIIAERINPQTREPEPVTVAMRIEESIRHGLPFGLACQAAGISRDTGTEWRNIAGRKRIEAKGRTLDDLELTAHEQRCIQFSDAIARAEGEAALRFSLLGERRMAGFEKVKTVVTERRNPAGELIERVMTTTTEQVEPDGAMIRWWFEKRFPALYMPPRNDVPRDDVPLTDDETAESLADSFSAFLAAHDAAPEAEMIVQHETEQPEVRPRRKRDDRGRVVEDPSTNGDS